MDTAKSKTEASRQWASNWKKIKKPLEITVLMISVKKYQTSKRTDVEVFLSTQSKFYLEYL